MGNKSIILVSILVSAIFMGASQVQGQSLGISIVGTNVSLVGTVLCTVNGTIGINGTSIPAFSNATVQLRIGNIVVASATTNGTGVFSISLNYTLLPIVLSPVLSNVNLLVTTPLSSCNASLPSTGRLVSLPPLQATVQVILAPGAFVFDAIVN